jgi:hypothetical protein
MTAPRIRFGGCSFIPPEGFIVQEDASLPNPSVSTCEHCLNATKPSVSITLISTAVHPEVPDYSESPEDMHPAAYPPTLTLTTVPECGNVSPLDHLRSTGAVLKDHLEGFKTDYCRNDVVGGSPAACSQDCFHTNFRILRLNLVWIIDGMLVTSTMTLTEPGRKKGWRDLRKFAESVRF